MAASFALLALGSLLCWSSDSDAAWLCGFSSVAVVSIVATMASLNVAGSSIRYKNLLVVIKQTAFEEYSQVSATEFVLSSLLIGYKLVGQLVGFDVTIVFVEKEHLHLSNGLLLFAKLKLRGQAPKALRWKRLEQRYKAHKQCVTDLLSLLRKQRVVQFSCVNRVDLDRQHLAGVDLIVAVGGDGTVLSSAHFVDHGTIPLLGINSDPNISSEDRQVKKKKSDERRSHGALCSFTALNMEEGLQEVLHGGGNLQKRTRIRCKVKSTFSETLLVPALNDLLIANPSPAAVSRYRMGWMQWVHDEQPGASQPNEGTQIYGTVTRFGGSAYHVHNSLNVWSSGMWVCTATGSTAAMAAAGGKPMPDLSDTSLQYLIREHMRETIPTQSPPAESGSIQPNANTFLDNDLMQDGQKLHIRWNSQTGRIFIDGSHLTHHLELGDEIMIDNQAPPLQMYSVEKRVN